jgi:hypothetical protein
MAVARNSRIAVVAWKLIDESDSFKFKFYDFSLEE